MTATPNPPSLPLEASSPFEMRVDQAKDVPEPVLKTAVATGDTGFLHSFTTGSAVDGPGVRVVAWTAGCHWRCQYCHNPDTWNMRNGIPVTLAHAVDELRKYQHGLRIMSGGLTISGGEPLVQHRFVSRLFSAAKAMEIHTALDTNGHLGERLSDEELKSIDLVLLDLKTWDSERHHQLTGHDNAPTLEFARRLAQKNRPIWLRFVLVPGISDGEGNIRQIAKFAADLGNVQRVDVLPFHQMGRFKWQELGLNYTLGDTEPPSADKVQWACSLFHAEGLKAY